MITEIGLSFEGVVMGEGSQVCVKGDAGAREAWGGGLACVNRRSRGAGRERDGCEWLSWGWGWLKDFP